MRTNIFICHTPFHNFITSHLCRTDFADDENIIITSVWDNRQQTHFRYLLTGNGLTQRLSGLRRARAEIYTAVNGGGQDVYFFLPHVDGVLGNFIFHSRRLTRKGAHINLYYDGILMLDPDRQLRRFPRLLTIKRLLSASIGHFFISYRDILPVDSSRTKHVYTPLPAHTPTALQDKLIQIRFPKMKAVSAMGHVFILGADVGIALEFSYKRIISHILEDEKINKISFKPHHADRQNIFQKIARKQNLSYELVKEKICVEELIFARQPQYIIAPYLSSALINIKVIFGSSVKVLCIAKSEAVDASGAEIAQVAKRLGVELITF